MHRYMIEIAHEATTAACVKVVETFHETGSHYLTHADFSCADGVHVAWLVIEADSADQARLCAPPFYRNDAKVIRVKHYSTLTYDEIIVDHQNP